MNPRKAWLRSQVSTLAIGQLVDGSISLVKDYGVFVDIGNGFHALLHISNISQGEIEHPSTIFSEGDLVKAIIVSIDRHKGRILVSTSDLEAVPGDMMRDPKRVYSSAETMADQYRNLTVSRLRKNKHWQEDGLYSTPSANDLFSVIKILKLDEHGVHIQLYSNKYPEPPADVNPSELYIVMKGRDRRNPGEAIGIGHAPISWESFLSWSTEYIKTVPVCENELEGYRMWLKYGGDSYF